MDVVLDNLVQGLKQSLLMAYAVWWALVFGFLISAVVQAEQLRPNGAAA